MTQLATRNEAAWDHYQVLRAVKKLSERRDLRTMTRTIFSKKRRDVLLRPAAYANYHGEYREMRAARRALRGRAAADAIGSWGEDIAIEWLETADVHDHAQLQVTASGRAALGATESSFDLTFEWGGRGYGVEVKNQMAPLSFLDVDKKLKLATAMNVRPIFLARRVERYEGQKIAAAGGYVVTWGMQFVPESLREPAEFLSTTYGLPFRVGRPTWDEMLRASHGFFDALLEEEGIDLDTLEPRPECRHLFVSWDEIDKQMASMGRAVPDVESP
ncbi:MAG: hypothetical protein HY084_11970 [Gemmatimonadetes bacterium]|nr:hypothetical protein [Gemmatimonadota bacterium]